jgi:hypothetical protein
MEDQDYSHSQRKWVSGGRWRNEVNAQKAQSELDSKTVHVVPGPPAELEAREPATSDIARDDELGHSVYTPGTECDTASRSRL